MRTPCPTLVYETRWLFAIRESLGLLALPQGVRAMREVEEVPVSSGRVFGRRLSLSLRKAATRMMRRETLRPTRRLPQSAPALTAVDFARSKVIIVTVVPLPRIGRLVTRTVVHAEFMFVCRDQYMLFLFFYLPCDENNKFNYFNYFNSNEPTEI